MSSTLELLRFKAESGLSDKSFTKVLSIFKDMLPDDNELPESTVVAKKVICPLGLEVQKIHACINDCMLYHGEKYKDLRACPICKHPRYKRKRARDKNKSDDEIKKGIPNNVVWYLPIIPRLKRLFANPGEAKLMRWHEDGRNKDKMLRHPANAVQW